MARARRRGVRTRCVPRPLSPLGLGRARLVAARRRRAPRRAGGPRLARRPVPERRDGRAVELPHERPRGARRRGNGRWHPPRPVVVPFLGAARGAETRRAGRAGGGGRRACRRRLPARRARRAGRGLRGGRAAGRLGAAADPDALRHRASRSSSSPSAERRSWSPWRDGSPRGGDAGRGVGAHRRLGDPGGAARVWRASDAATSPRTATWRGKGVVLCLAGDYDAALPELERHWRTSVEADRSGTWRAEFLGVVAECALRAGDKAQLDVAVDEMSRTRRGRALAFRYEAESDPGKAVARLQRRLALDPNGENDRSTLDDQVFALSILADAGDPDELPAYAAGGPAGLELAVLEANPPGESLYDDRLHPPFDGRLRRAIDALAGLEAPAAHDAAAGLTRPARRAPGPPLDDRMAEAGACGGVPAGLDAARADRRDVPRPARGRSGRRAGLACGLASGARRRAARRGLAGDALPHCSCG